MTNYCKHHTYKMLEPDYGKELPYSEDTCPYCQLAALQNTEDSKKDRCVAGDYGWSASYGDVCRAVDRELELRTQNETLQAENE